ncbi:hypothetical protein JCGZ_10786 [Jatropha curcas]|uniref:Uncharacterized protein n=1 Tax=Jatropha curcas TaxID=180498 RepID=A0A067LR26_JATCU|nr:hypothetical protein JCGZ_22408 [Jatropha curcas]KDP47059.1 hypothetical protein JCGZ_10786 [Jatropha curcas]
MEVELVVVLPLLDRRQKRTSVAARSDRGAGGETAASSCSEVAREEVRSGWRWAQLCCPVSPRTQTQ